jgi:hypothetical protein
MSIATQIMAARLFVVFALANGTRLPPFARRAWRRSALHDGHFVNAGEEESDPGSASAASPVKKYVFPMKNYVFPKAPFVHMYLYAGGLNACCFEWPPAKGGCHENLSQEVYLTEFVRAVVGSGIGTGTVAGDLRSRNTGPNGIG